MVKTRTADGTMLETTWESRWLPDSNGGVAQLGEHLPCKQGVKSSNLSISTHLRKDESITVMPAHKEAVCCNDCYTVRKENVP